jgi:4-fold beta flower protein
MVRRSPRRVALRMLIAGGLLMLPIRDQTGKTCGWLNGARLHDLTGRPVAFLASYRHVYTYMGAHLGHLEDGYFCDRAGNAVAWLDDASGGPRLPSALPAPVPPIPQTPLRDELPLPSPSVPPTPTHTWSSLTWDRFCAGS